MDQIQKALNTLEIAHMMGQVDNETIEKARNKSGLYSDTTYNRKKGRANQPYNKRSDMEGHFKGETSTGKKFDVRHEAEHENHKEFTSEEHKEVAEKHRKMVSSVHSEEQKDYHRKQAEEHERMGKEKSKNDILNDYDKKEADKHFIQLANRFKNEPLSLVEHFAVKMKEDYFKDHSGSTSHDTSSAKFDRNRIAGMEEYLKNRKEEESKKEDKKEPYDGKKALKEFQDRDDAVMQKITPEQRKQARKEWEDAGAKEDWHDFLDKYAEKYGKKDLTTRVKENEDRKKRISIEEHRKNETAFMESLKKEKTSEGINKRFKEISNDQKYIDMPTNRQNYIADYADELESKLKDDFSSAVKSAMFPKTYTDKPKEKQPYHKNDGLDVFRDIAMKVKDAREFIDKTREIKGVPDKIANKFAEKYGKGGILSMEKTSQNFIDEVKGSK